MSAWHRLHPELAGGPLDPWMANERHRKALESLVREGHVDCPVCGGRGVLPDGLTRTATTTRASAAMPEQPCPVCGGLTQHTVTCPFANSVAGEK